MVRYLCTKFGPDKYDLDSTAQNCLHWASREGHPKVVRYLIEQQGFDPSLMDSVSVCDMLHLSVTTQQQHNTALSTQDGAYQAVKWCWTLSMGSYCTLSHTLGVKLHGSQCIWV